MIRQRILKQIPSGTGILFTINMSEGTVSIIQLDFFDIIYLACVCVRASMYTNMGMCVCVHACVHIYIITSINMEQYHTAITQIGLGGLWGDV
jgi:hypothetical protein